MTPRKKKLVEKLRNTKCTLASLRKSATLIEKIKSQDLKEIVKSALKNQDRKPKGRRWTVKNKISALAIYKRSPKTYRCLQKMMPLPNEKTLQNLLKKIPLETGINHAVLEHLKKISEKETSQNKVCVLAFDEIALKPRLIYNSSSDKVEGYTDYGSTEARGPELADHALVFLIQGLRKKFKQPFAFYFVKGTVSSQKLATLIKEIIKLIKGVGYNVLATVCDQGPTNIGALKILKSMNECGEHERKNTFLVDDQKVYTLYDVPHLFKSIRNNFFNNGTMEMDGKKAKWEHLKEVEQKNNSLLYLSKISNTHVHPKFKAKMRVKYAAQMLSNTVSAVLKLMAEAEKNEIKADEIMQTGIIIQELDRLFDVTNGPSGPHDIKKGIRENVSEKTTHLQKWAEYRKKLKTVKFFKQSGAEAKNNKCIEGYIMTLSSLQDLWHEVHKLGFKYLNLRQLNQDSLENLFGIIRQHSPTDKNPTCAAFVAALRTSIVTGLSGASSRHSNCLEDSSKLLTDYNNYIDAGKLSGEDDEVTKQTEISTIKEIEVDFTEESPNLLHLSDDENDEDIENDLMDIKNQPVVYLAGYLAHTLKSRPCAKCKDCLQTENTENKIYSYIKFREWWEERHALIYPSVALCKTIESAVDVFEKNVLPVLHKRNICHLAVTLFYASYEHSWFTCQDHKSIIFDILFHRLGQLLVRRQCKRINLSLALREEDLNNANKRAQQHAFA